MTNLPKPWLALAALYMTGCAATAQIAPYPTVSVQPRVETDPMEGEGDKADDPALWFNKADPARSLLLGTNKDEGLYVYGLDGTERQRLLVGQVNNVDVRGDLAAASNDELNAISWFTIDSDVSPIVQHWGDSPVTRDEPYGICLGVLDGVATAAVTYKDGAIELWALTSSSASAPSASLVYSVQLPSQLEGCVFDEAFGRLFVGEEAFGIWVINLNDADAPPGMVDAIARGNGLVEDVEGISLYKSSDGGGYLVASAQAADRFVVYDRQPPYTARGAFGIAANPQLDIDAVSHTDGLDVSSVSLPAYPAGVVIVQDDGNPQSGVNQNFKLVDWREIRSALQLR